MTPVNPLHLLDNAIRPALIALSRVHGYRTIASPEAEMLLLGTAAAESAFRHRRQIGGGPGLGLFQIEPATHRDTLESFTRFRPPLDRALRLLRESDLGGDDAQIQWNDAYAAAVARLRYWRSPGRLPDAGDVDGLARYWKQHYNTPLGKGTERHFVEAWEAMVAPALTVGV